MVVNFEFLGNEPIENVITCVNFKVDKVIFFGYHGTIQSQKDRTENFLQKYCGVDKVIFHSLSHNDLHSVLHTMKKEIEHELSIGANIYFDITGGESLILVAFGMLSKEFDTPMHLYDVPTNQLIELDGGSVSNISKEVPVQSVKMDLDRFIEMRGGSINYCLQKNIKEAFSEDFEKDISAIWEVAKQFGDYWNSFSDFVNKHMLPDGNLQVIRNSRAIVNALAKSTNILKTPAQLNQILDALNSKGILMDLQHANGKYRFRFKNQEIKDCLCEGGSILELHIYQQEKNNSDDCRVGVHIDWDGIVHSQSGVDVLNEIDVLSLKGFVPKFISCKSGRMASQQTLHALYELDTVAKRFGGKYAQKILVTAKNIGDIYIKRAHEMGIDVNYP